MGWVAYAMLMVLSILFAIAMAFFINYCISRMYPQTCKQCEIRKREDVVLQATRDIEPNIAEESDVD